MKTVSVPVDFSATALHTARYAAQLLVGQPGVDMLLYHSYSKPAEEAAAHENLEELKKELAASYNVNTDILTQLEDDFVKGLERAVRHRKADLVIMGITGKSALAQVFFGSNTLKAVESKTCPI